MKRDAGFTLLELMIASAVTLVILALTMSAFRSGLQMTEAVGLMTGTNQNLQSASYYLTQDLTKAGNDVPVGGASIPNGAGANQIVWPRTVAPQSFFPASVTLNAVTTGDALGPPVRDTAAGLATNSDVITVVYVDHLLPALTLDNPVVNAAGTTGVVHYDPANANPALRGTQINSTPANAVLQGDLFLFTNANGTTVQEVTQSGNAGNPQGLLFGTNDVLKFNQPGLPIGRGGIATLMQVPPPPPPPAPAPGVPPITIQRLTMVTYYIDTTTPTQPLLMRRIYARNPVPVAIGMENLQLSYDIYRDGFIAMQNTPAPANANEIRKITVYLGGRSEDKSRQSKNYIRNSMQTQVTVRSLGLYDKYPGTPAS
jgi:prepilin-type N-terminal cleavage/methylation domain-containing protein